MAWATPVPILVFLGLSVLELRPMYARVRLQIYRRQTKASLNASSLWGRRHNNINFSTLCKTYRLFDLRTFSQKMLGISQYSKHTVIIMPPPIIIIIIIIIHAEHVVHRRGYCFHFGCMFVCLYVCMYVSALERKRLIGMT